MYHKKTREEKLRIVSLHEQGYGSTTIGTMLGIEARQVQRLLVRYRVYGLSGLDRLPKTKATGSFKVEVAKQVLEKSLSLDRVALHYNIGRTAVFRWVHQAKAHGYESLLASKPRGRPPKAMGRPRKKEPQTELEKLQYENECLRTENALLKKVKALVESRDAQRQKIGRKPSKN